MSEVEIFIGYLEEDVIDAMLSIAVSFWGVDLQC